MTDQNYRILRPEEVIQEGDELFSFNSKSWIPVTSHNTIGVSSGCFKHKFRRTIPPVSKSATTEALKELYKCVQCGSEFTEPEELVPPWECETCGISSLEPVLPVKESLTTETDDNGEPICKKCGDSYTLKPDHEPADYCHNCVYDVLAAMKLRAEKAEAGRNECERQFQTKVAEVAVWMDKSEQAERERDEANALAKETWKTVCQLRTELDESKKERDALRAELETTNEQLQTLKSEFLSQIFERFKSDDRIRKWATEQLAALAGKGGQS